MATLESNVNISENFLDKLIFYPMHTRSNHWSRTPPSVSCNIGIIFNQIFMQKRKAIGVVMLESTSHQWDLGIQCSRERVCIWKDKLMVQQNHSPLLKAVECGWISIQRCHDINFILYWEWPCETLLSKIDFYYPTELDSVLGFLFVTLQRVFVTDNNSGIPHEFHANL